MDHLLAARSQMAFTLIFHIVFACIGMVMPFLLVTSHYKWLKTRQEKYLKLTKAWQKGVAIFFVTGAVSGTALSFEMGLLWPEFMKHAGPIIGMPFSLEGAAFFVEAIAIGFYLYGWNKLNEKFHWFTGVIVGVSGVGEFTNINPIKAMLNPAWFTQALHMTLAAFAATGFAVAGLHAFQILKNKQKELHLAAFKIAMTFGAIAALLQPLSGDLSAKDIAVRQPVKLAAMEAHYHTSKGAPLYIGGIVDNEKQEVKYKLEIPKALSFLAFGDFDAEVKGLNDFPKDERPNVAIVHYAFQIMVSIGGAMAMAGILFFVALFFKKQWFKHKLFLSLFFALTPLGYIALEAGWIVTEVGRQPWIIHGIMKTKDAVTPVPGIEVSFYMYIVLYSILTIAVAWLLSRQIKAFNNK